MWLTLVTSTYVYSVFYFYKHIVIRIKIELVILHFLSTLASFVLLLNLYFHINIDLLRVWSFTDDPLQWRRQDWIS